MENEELFAAAELPAVPEETPEESDEVKEIKRKKDDVVKDIDDTITHITSELAVMRDKLVNDLENKVKEYIELL